MEAGPRSVAHSSRVLWWSPHSISCNLYCGERLLDFQVGEGYWQSLIEELFLEGILHTMYFKKMRFMQSN